MLHVGFYLMFRTGAVRRGFPEVPLPGPRARLGGPGASGAVAFEGALAEGRRRGPGVVSVREGVPDARRVSVRPIISRAPRTGTWGSSAFGSPPEAPGRGDRAGPVPGPNEVLSSGNRTRGVQPTRTPNETTKHHNDEAHCGSVSRVEAACQRLALPTSPTPCGLPRA